MRVTILGGGYAGLNVYYNLGRKYEKTLVSDNGTFTFYTAYFQYLMRGTNYISSVDFINIKKIRELDLERREVKFSDGTTDNPDIMIVALGCNKEGVISSINSIIRKSDVSLSAESWRDEIVAIQLAFYLKKMNKMVKYSGDLLKWAGKKISNAVTEELERKGIRISEKAEDIIPECKAPEEVGEVEYRTNFEIKKNVYGIGDLIKGWPRTGELAMRSGVFVGKYLSGKTVDNFKPILINIIDLGDGRAIHFRSEKPWGGELETVKLSRVRAILKRYIERHYVRSRGNMGFLYNL